MTIYNTRYQARKHSFGGDVIVSVDDGMGGIGYMIMRIEDYWVWRRQK